MCCKYTMNKKNIPHAANIYFVLQDIIHIFMIFFILISTLMDYSEIYRQIAAQNDFLFEINKSEIKVLGSDNGNMVRSEYVTMTKDNVIYCASDSYAPKAFMNSTYSGYFSHRHPVISVIGQSAPN